MAADLAEILALIMSSKSAQFEFCVDDSQKSWLGTYIPYKDTNWSHNIYEYCLKAFHNLIAHAWFLQLGSLC